MTPEDRMGMSNMWAWAEGKKEVAYPETPWALSLAMKDFPYPRDFHGEWFWESGFDKDPIHQAEEIRDWNLRAVYGAFNAMKNGDGSANHKKAYLTWIAYIGGPRESRRLLGDVILTQSDIHAKREFPDGCVPSTWSIDLHYPKKQYAKKFPDNPFVSIAVHDRNVDRSFGYPVPYRCFYSRNIDNLFMAGRCVSATHEALGTIRVMRTCGMMGEVVGKATSLCVLKECSPREVYSQHWDAMDALLKLPGKARRNTIEDEIVIPSDVMPLAESHGSPKDERPKHKGLDPRKLEGLVVDDAQAKATGNWTNSTTLAGFVGSNYRYASGDAEIDFEFKAPATGRFEIRVAYQPHKNRGTHVPVKVQIGHRSEAITVDMTKSPTLKNGFISLGDYSMTKGEKGIVTIGTKGARGIVHADAVQIVKTDS